MADSCGWWSCDNPNLDPNAETYQMAITNRLGFGVPWNASWEPGNWMTIRASLEWVFHGPPRDNSHVYQFNDGDHVMLFPQDVEGLCPRDWLDAAWPFLEHFRSNNSFYPQQAFTYRKVTLIGQPLGNRLGIAPEIEDALRRAPWRQVERLPIMAAGELAEVLQERIRSNERFPKQR